MIRLRHMCRMRTLSILSALALAVLCKPTREPSYRNRIETLISHCTWVEQDGRWFPEWEARFRADQRSVSDETWSNPDSFQLLLALIEESNSPRRETALRYLAGGSHWLTDPEFLERMAVYCTSGRKHEARWLAAESIGALGSCGPIGGTDPSPLSPKAVEVLLSYLGREDPADKRGAVFAAVVRGLQSQAARYPEIRSVLYAMGTEIDFQQQWPLIWRFLASPHLVNVEFLGTVLNTLSHCQDPNLCNVHISFIRNGIVMLATSARTVDLSILNQLIALSRSHMVEGARCDIAELLAVTAAPRADAALISLLRDDKSDEFRTELWRRLESRETCWLDRERRRVAFDAARNDPAPMVRLQVSKNILHITTRGGAFQRIDGRVAWVCLEESEAREISAMLAEIAKDEKDPRVRDAIRALIQGTAR